MLPTRLVPYANLPIWEMTVGVPLMNGATCILLSIQDRPKNIAPSNEPMITRVCRAFFQAGCLNAGTPFEIASTPVTAAPPDANECSTTASPAPTSRPEPLEPNGTRPFACA